MTQTDENYGGDIDVAQSAGTAPAVREVADRFVRAATDVSGLLADTWDEVLTDDVTWQVMGSAHDLARTHRGKAQLYSGHLAAVRSALHEEHPVITAREIIIDESKGAFALHLTRSGSPTLATPGAVEVLFLVRLQGDRVRSVEEFSGLAATTAADVAPGS